MATLDCRTNNSFNNHCYKTKMKNITFAIPLIVGLALATPVLAQEATSTDQTTLAGQTEQSISPTDTVASEEGPTESASVESEPTAEASPAPENAQPVDHAELPSPAADQSQETAVADGSTATPANSEQSAREDTPAGDSDHVHTPEGIRIKYYVECDQLYQADVFGSSAPALCHDDLGKKYEMTITPEEYGRLETGGKLYKQILMTVEYAHQNAVKKITDAGRTEADIPKSLFDDPTVQNAQQPAENSQESSAATTTSEISASPEVTTDNAADTPAKDPNSASPPSETTTSVAAADVHAPAPTGDEPEPSPTPDDARSAPTATSPAKDTSAADTTSAITSSTTDLVQ
jgi:hypothetical protein